MTLRGIGSDTAPLDNPVLQRDLYQGPQGPFSLTLQAVDGGKNVLATLQVGDQFYTHKVTTLFRLYYLSAAEVSASQIQQLGLSPVPVSNAPYFQTITSKRKWLMDIPMTGKVMTAVISSTLVSAGGWIYATGVNKIGREFDIAGISVAVPIPVASAASAVPKYEITNPQVSFSADPNATLRGRTYRDSITIAYQAPSPLDTFRYLQIWIYNYQNDGQLREGPVFSYFGTAGKQGVGRFFLETDSNGFGTHDVIFYFVALSATFNHRTDFVLPGIGSQVPIPIVTRGGPQASRIGIPYVVIRGGIVPQMTPPIAPQPTAVVLGSKVQLTWTEINDENIDHVNIYRANQGVLLTPVVNAQPATPFKIVTKDQIVVSGTNTWLDADFNDYRAGNPQYSPTTPPNDFSVTNPAQFKYWLTCVNLAGQESTRPQDTGTIVLRGVDGTDTHPGATYRDNHFNCFWNCQFNSDAGAASVPVTTAHQTRTPPNDAAGDAYGKWQNDSQGTVGTVPQFVSNGATGTGEVDIFPNTSTNINDFVRVYNDSPRSIFLTGESLVSSVMIGYSGNGNAPSQSVALGIAEVSGGVQIGGSYIIAYFPGSILNNVGTGGSAANYTRIVGYGVLALNSFDHLRLAIGLKSQTAPGGAPTGMIRIMQPMVNGGTEVANWTATVRDQDAPGSGGGGPGGGGTPPSGGGQCAVAGTLIDTPDCQVPVEDLVCGDAVWSPIHRSWARISGVTDFLTDQVWSISTDGGLSLCASPDHPILVKTGPIRRWKKICRVRPGDIVYTYQWGAVTKQKVTAVFVASNCHAVVYALSLDQHKNYSAGGIVSHNKNYGHQV